MPEAGFQRISTRYYPDKMWNELEKKKILSTRKIATKHILRYWSINIKAIRRSFLSFHFLESKFLICLNVEIDWFLHIENNFFFSWLFRYSAQFLKASKAVPVALARQRYPRPTAEQLANYLNDSLSFLIVRHPFERLLSGYRDKFEQSLPNTFHSKLGSHIVSHYRKKVSLTSNNIFELHQFIYRIGALRGTRRIRPFAVDFESRWWKQFNNLAKASTSILNFL